MDNDSNCHDCLHRERKFSETPCRECNAHSHFEARVAVKAKAPFPALSTQVGGDHYKTLGIQPVEYCIANKLDFFQKDILKYITRRKGDKAKRLEDLRKAKHYLEMYIEAIEQGKWE